MEELKIPTKEFKKAMANYLELFDEKTKRFKAEYFEKDILIEARDDIYNSKIFYGQLKSNSVYKVSIGEIQLLSGETIDITFNVKDTKKNKPVLLKYIRIFDFPSVVSFATGEDAADLELKIYSGVVGKANGISIKISDILLERAECTQEEITYLNFFGTQEQLFFGYETALKYCSFDERTYYIIVNRHIGDSMRYLSLIKPFRDYYGPAGDRNHFGENQKNNASLFSKRKLIEKIVVLTDKSNAGLAQLYADDIDEINVLTKSELNALEYYAVSSNRLHKNIFADENARFYAGDSTYESSWVRNKLYGVDDHMWDLTIPIGSEPAKMRIVRRTKNDAGKLIARLNLDTAKTVILCPAAKSTSTFDDETWERFADKLKTEGYRVFTNVAGKEKVIKGTALLATEIDCLCALAQMGCKIIGVQSGLMDILVGYENDLDITVIHPVKQPLDEKIANDRKATQLINKFGSRTHIRVENFDIEYIMQLLSDVFYKRHFEPGYRLQVQKSENKKDAAIKKTESKSKLPESKSQKKEDES